MKIVKYVIAASALILSACTIDRIIVPEVSTGTPKEVSTLGFSLMSALTTPTTISIRASWALPPSDGAGNPEYYLHTMTANRALGVLPTRKRVNGLADTVTINRPAINDTVIIISQVWSVRRGLESTTPATGKVVIRTADQAPPRPDTVFVDTIVLTPAIQAPASNLSANLFTVVPSNAATNAASYLSLFIREENGETTYHTEEATYITLVKK